MIVLLWHWLSSWLPAAWCLPSATYDGAGQPCRLSSRSDPGVVVNLLTRPVREVADGRAPSGRRSRRCSRPASLSNHRSCTNTRRSAEVTCMVDLTRDQNGQVRARLLDLVLGWSGPAYAGWLDARQPGDGSPALARRGALDWRHDLGRPA